MTPDDGDRDPPTGAGRARATTPCRSTPSPVDAVVLRETADGWVDLDGTSFQQSGGRDLPRTTPNTRVFVLDQDGTGLALGGIAGIADQPARAGPGRGLRDRAPVRSRRPRPARRAGLRAGRDRPTPGDAVRLAIGGHPACLDRCTGGGGQGLTPGRPCRARRSRASKSMVAAGNGPAALLFGGGRASRRRRAAGRGRRTPLPRADAGRGRADLRPARARRHGGRRRRRVRRARSPTRPHRRGRGAAPDGVDAAAVTQPESRRAPRRVLRVRRARRGGHGARRRDRQRRRPPGRRAGRTAGAVAARRHGRSARDRGIPVVVVGSALAGRRAADAARRRRRRRARAARRPRVGVRGDGRHRRPARPALRRRAEPEPRSRPPAPPLRWRCSSPRRSATRRRGRPTSSTNELRRGARSPARPARRC